MKYSGVTHPENVDLSKVTIAMPVYNEDVDVFRESIESVAMQGCKFVVVGDSSDEPYRSMVEKAGGKFILQEIRGGQKKAISRAFDFVHTEFVLLVDSDTILPSMSSRPKRIHPDLAHLTFCLRNFLVSFCG